MISYTYHRLLLRQIKKISGSFSNLSEADMKKLLETVSQTYEEYDKSQERSDRAAKLMSEELVELNREIRKEAEHELELSEQKYQNIIDNISGVIFSHFLVGDRVIPNFISPHIEELSDYASEDFVNGEIKFESIIHHDDLAKYREAIDSSRDDNKMYQIEYRIIGKDQAPVWVFEQGKVRMEGEQTRIDGVIININKQKLAEEELIKTAREAREASRAKSEFLSNMSHELRTPMHGILSYAELGSSGIDLHEPESKVKGYFESIGRSGTRLLNLLNNLLDLAKMDSGKMNYHYSEQDIIPAIKQGFDEMHILAERKGVILSANYPPEPLMMPVDRHKIVQVVVNLLSNAVKFTPKGKNVMITVEKHEAEGYLLLQVSDQGVGVPLEQMETIFHQFVQSTRTSAGAGGTGLGLSITKEIVKAHNGRIWVVNNQDHGATFKVELPLKG